MAILPRQYYCNPNIDNCYGYTTWDSWGRWLTIAGIIAFFFFLFLLLACVTARRRRRNGIQPYRGTGWMAGPPPYQPNSGYYGNPAPPYNHGGYYQPPPTDQQQHGYYGNQQNGVEMQPPQQAYVPPEPYRAHEDVYSPPVGPPPKK